MKDVNGNEVKEETEVTKVQPTHEELLSEVTRFVGELDGKYKIYGDHWMLISKLFSAVAMC